MVDSKDPKTNLAPDADHDPVEGSEPEHGASPSVGQERREEHAPPNHQLIAAWVFGSLSFILLATRLFLGPNEQLDPLIRFFAALCGGFLGFLLPGNIALITDSNIPMFGKLAVRAGGGCALFALVWLTWPSPQPGGPVAMQRLDLIIKRNGLVEPEIWPLVRGGSPQTLQQLGPLSNQDLVRVEGKLSRPSYWAVIWIDSVGRSTVEHVEDSPTKEIHYPRGRSQSKPVGVSISDGDPEGWQAISLIVSPQALSTDARHWPKALGEIGPPPTPPKLDWSHNLLGPKDSVYPIDPSPFWSFRNAIDAVLGDDATQAHLLFLRWQPNR